MVWYEADIATQPPLAPIPPTQTAHQRLTAQVAGHLAPGEKLVVVQPQLSWRTLPGGIGTNVLFLFAALVIALLGGGMISSGRFGPFFMFFWLALLVLVGGPPLLAARRARGRAYAVTSQRFLIVQAAKARVISASEIRRVEHVEHHAGGGDLRLQHGAEGKLRWERFRGVDEVAMVARGIQLVIAHGDVDAFMSAPFFRREHDEVAAAGAGMVGCMAFLVLFPLAIILSFAREGQWLGVVFGFPVFWGFVIVASRRWFGVRQKAVHSLEVAATGVSWCTYSMHIAKARLVKEEHTVPFDQIEAIAIQWPAQSGAVQALVVAGARRVLPAQLLPTNASVARFVRTVQHYVPTVPVRGDVELLDRAE